MLLYSHYFGFNKRQGTGRQSMWNYNIWYYSMLPRFRREGWYGFPRFWDFPFLLLRIRNFLIFLPRFRNYFNFRDRDVLLLYTEIPRFCISTFVISRFFFWPRDFSIGISKTQNLEQINLFLRFRDFTFFLPRFRDQTLCFTPFKI